MERAEVDFEKTKQKVGNSFYRATQSGPVMDLGTSDVAWCALCGQINLLAEER